MSFERRACEPGPPPIPHRVQRARRWRPIRVLRRAARRAEGLSPARAAAVASALLALVVAGDRVAGLEASFTLLYLAPVALATWNAGAGAGIGFALAGAAASALLALDAPARPAPWVSAWNGAVQLGVSLLVVALLRALAARLLAEQELARTDPLTRIANRRAFLEAAAQELARLGRHGRPLTVAYLDVDDFKLVNDRYGHAEGDGVLAHIAGTLRGETRPFDVVARLGGDEFGLLLSDTDGPRAEQLVERLRLALRARLAERGYQVGFSIGTVTFLAPPRSVDEMLQRADRLMYEAKRSSKDAGRFDVVGPGQPPPGEATRAADVA